MGLKKKLTIIVLTITGALFLFCGCGNKNNAEQDAINNGATVKITFDLVGGKSSDQEKRYVRIKPNTPVALPWSVSNMINAPTKEGYSLLQTTWYEGTVDDDGNVIYGKEHRFNRVGSGASMRYVSADKFSEDLTLYAKWKKRFAFRVIDISDGTTVINNVYCNEGQAFDTSDANAKTISGKTFINYYKDKNMQNEWDAGFLHPGFPEGVTEDTAADEDYYYDVYAYYIEGNYTKVREAKDFVASAANYYLIGDENKEIDFAGKWNFNPMFIGEIIGNGVTIKNAKLTQTDYNGKNIGLFGELKGTAEKQIKITGVTFKDCTVEVIYNTNPFKDNLPVNVGFLAGSASYTTLEKVKFENCNVIINIADSENKPVVTAEIGDIWSNRENDGANFNDIKADVIIDVIITGKNENQ